MTNQTTNKSTNQITYRPTTSYQPTNRQLNRAIELTTYHVLHGGHCLAIRAAQHLHTRMYKHILGAWMNRSTAAMMDGLGGSKIKYGELQ